MTVNFNPPNAWLRDENLEEISLNPLVTTFLEVGGGNAVQFGWGNLDPVHGEGEFKRSAQDTPWPLEDNSVDRIVASHVMEHIPAGQDRINVMNEMHRVLKPSGRLLVMVPILGDGSIGKFFYTAVADPTHISFWLHESFEYFTGEAWAGADYGIKKWQELSWDTDRFFWEGRWVGMPVK